MSSLGKRVWRFILALLGSCMLLLAHSDALATLDARTVAQKPLSLTTHFAVLEDPEGVITLADVQTPEWGSRFEPVTVPGSALSYGFTRSAYWFRLAIDNPGELPLERLIEISNYALSEIAFFQPQADGSYLESKTGSLWPFATRLYAHRFPVFPVTLSTQSSKVYYFRIQAHDGLVVPAQMWLPEVFDAHARTDYMLQAWYFGMATAMVLFNLLLFVVLREIRYLLYVASVGFMALSIFAFNGLAHEFLWPRATRWSDVAHFIGWSFTGSAVLLFLRKMLDTQMVMPRFDRMMKPLVGLYMVMAVGLSISFEAFAAPSVIANVLGLIFCICVGVVGALKRQRTAYIFLIAFFIMLIGGIVTVLRGLGVLPDNFITANGLQVGSALEMVLLALALADRFNQIRKEKADAQRDALQAQQRMVDSLQTSERLLEQRVTERTLELSAAIDQLKQTQTELVQSAKLASLGSLVAGISHELNTPIGVVVTVASTLDHSMNSLRESVKSGEMRKSTLTQFLEDTTQAAQLLVRSANRAAKLIASFKEVAVDQTSENRRVFDLGTTISDNIEALRPSFRHQPWLINVDIPTGISCDSYPGPLGQVISNLVQNAVLHAFAERESGTVTITARVSGQNAEITCADDGNGMPPSVLGHIFEPFYTTRLGQGGSGLGLSVSMNIVTGVLGGTLIAQSEEGQGTRFILKFPLVAPKHAKKLPSDQVFEGKES